MVFEVGRAEGQEGVRVQGEKVRTCCAKYEQFRKCTQLHLEPCKCMESE